MKFKKLVVIGINKDQLDPKYWQQIDTLADQRVNLAEDDPRIETELKDADGLLVYFNRADKERIDQAPNLKYIGALATGVGKIDTEYAKSKGIVVTNIPGYSTEAVAELVFAVLLEDLRDIARAKTESKNRRTSESDFRGREIKGKTFGVIGLGHIGSRVVELASAFGAKVLYWSKNRKLDQEAQGIKFTELSELLENSDIVSIHLALNKETAGILNPDLISRIKPGSILINTAPLELLDLETIKTRLAKQEITFIFDHTDSGDISDEQLEALRSYDNCITYPVLGYVTDEARIAKQEIFVDNIKSFLEGHPKNIVS